VTLSFNPDPNQVILLFTRPSKVELIAKIVNDGGITKSQAEKAVDGFVSAVSDALATGDKITLVGFGTFSVGERAQREGRNPRTGESAPYRRQIEV